MAKTSDRDHQEDLLDEALDESFPASDPPSITRPHDLEQVTRQSSRGDGKTSGDVAGRGR